MNLLRRTGASYTAAAIAVPYTCAIASGAFRGIVADQLAQRTVDREDRDDDDDSPAGTDLRRTAKYALWTGLFTGGWQTWMYNSTNSRGMPAWFEKSPRLFGSASRARGPGFRGGLARATFDCVVYSGLFFFPVYFAYREVANGGGPAEVVRAVKDDWFFGGERARKTFAGFLALWVPAQVMTFAVVPPHLRVAWMLGVGLAWDLYLCVVAPMVDPRKATRGKLQPSPSASE